jgi:hypothetical protein
VSVDGLSVIRSNWSFDYDLQEITLLSSLPSDNYPVTVVFEPGLPVTYTYLEDQPLWEGALVINEGTPIEQLDQVGGYSYTVVPGNVITDRNTDFIDNTPYLYMEESNSSVTKYTDMDIIELRDTGEEGLLSFLCDETFSGHGMLGFTLSGGMFNDIFQITGPAVVIPPYPVLLLSGGSFRDGDIGSSILIHNGNVPSLYSADQLLLFTITP